MDFCVWNISHAQAEIAYADEGEAIQRCAQCATSEGGGVTFVVRHELWCAAFTKSSLLTHVWSFSVMTITKPSARKLATQAEWTLLETSYAPLLKDITLGRLKQKITRARKLQDKYRDLARQQRGEARGKRRAKSTRPVAGNENTVNKQLLFTEALERFQGQLTKLESKAAKELARKEKATSKRASSAKKTVAKKNARKASTNAARKASTKAARNAAPTVAAKRTSLRTASKLARGARKQGKLDRTGATAHQAHVGSRGRRRQARRDSR